MHSSFYGECGVKTLPNGRRLSLRSLHTRPSQARPRGPTGDEIRNLDHVVTMPDDGSESAVHFLVYSRGGAQQSDSNYMIPIVVSTLYKPISIFILDQVPGIKISRSISLIGKGKFYMRPLGI